MVSSWTSIVLSRARLAFAPFLKSLGVRSPDHLGRTAGANLAPSLSLPDVRDEVFSLFNPFAFKCVNPIIGATSGKYNSFIDYGMLLLRLAFGMFKDRLVFHLWHALTHTVTDTLTQIIARLDPMSQHHEKRDRHWS